MKKNCVHVFAICVSIFALACNNNISEAASEHADTSKMLSDSIATDAPAEGFPAARDVDTLDRIPDSTAKDSPNIEKNK